jgi:putative SOS response-associated peptidase YedK
MDARRAAAQRPKPAPFHHQIDDGGWLAFASRARVEDVEGPLVTVAIITTDAAGPAARLHDRIPVVLADPEAMQAWLSPELQLDDVPELLTDRRRPDHRAARQRLGEQRPQRWARAA